MTKICSKCKIEKNTDEFSKNKAQKDGLCVWCKNCLKNSFNKWELDNKEYRQIYSIQYYRNNIERSKENYKCWCFKNPERKKELKKQWDENNYEYRKEYDKQWELNNKEHRKNYKKEYNSQNRDYINIHLKQRRDTDIDFKIKIYYRNRICSALKNNQKCGQTIEMLGCSISEFRQYLEKQFKEGMNWSNYGKGIDKWNIDHIIPCAFFNMADPVEQKQCFHYSNLQPLWEVDNLRKSDKILNN